MTASRLNRHFVPRSAHEQTSQEDAVLVKIKKVSTVLTCSVLGAAFCLLAVWIVDKLKFAPSPPAFGGDEDFNTRFAYFACTAFPGFVIIGGLIGRVLNRSKLRALAMVGGVFAGSLVFFAAEKLLASAITNAPKAIANPLVLALFTAWVGCAALGAYWSAYQVRSGAHCSLRA